MSSHYHMAQWYIVYHFWDWGKLSFLALVSNYRRRSLNSKPIFGVCKAAHSDNTGAKLYWPLPNISVAERVDLLYEQLLGSHATLSRYKSRTNGYHHISNNYDLLPSELINSMRKSLWIN